MELPKQYKKKWITALRSGIYDQEDGALYNCGNFCAIGVALHACDDISIENLDGIHQVSDLESNLTDAEYRAIPREIRKGDLQDYVIDLNDNERYSFNMIADYIEENVIAR
tara:strand:- start:931 stop:1263 length:333 start_codon:yes stop_codon:yes gene_type:complete